MDVDVIKARLAEAFASKVADQADAFEVLYADVLRAIANGHADPVALARAALDRPSRGLGSADEI